MENKRRGGGPVVLQRTVCSHVNSHQRRTKELIVLLFAPPDPPFFVFFSSSLPFKMSVLVHSSPDIWTELRSAIDHIYSDYTEEPALDELSTNRGRHCVTEVLPSLLRRKPAL